MPRPIFKNVEHENHPVGFTGYPFVSVIVYRDKTLLCVIDDLKKHRLRAYVIDYIERNKGDDELFVQLATDWYDYHVTIPISIYISQQGYSSQFSSVLLDMNYGEIQRITGPAFNYDFDMKPKIRKKRRKPVDPLMDVAYTLAFG